MTISTPSKKQRLFTWLMLVQGAFWFCLILLIGVIATNWPALSQELKYVTKKPVPTTSFLPTPSQATPSLAADPIIESPHLIITKIGIDVPIIWQVAPDRTSFYLNQGVAHLAGSATPGQIGNIFISGHSSDFVWRNNPYAAVFALLPKLLIGDTIAIKENGQTFTYQIADTKIIEANDVTIAQPTTTQVLTLMTCYPIGTTKQRFVVQAVANGSIPEATNNSDITLPTITFR